MAEITYGYATYCQSDKAKPRHMDGASYETISYAHDANRQDISAPCRLMRCLDGDVDLHFVPEHHSAAFNRTIPFHTIIEPVHGRGGLEAESLGTVGVVLQSEKMPIEYDGFGNAANRKVAIYLRRVSIPFDLRALEGNCREAVGGKEVR